MKRLLILTGFLLFLLYPLQGAGNLYVYSDGPCPAGTSGSGKYMQVIKNMKVLAGTAFGNGCNAPSNQPPGYTECFAQSIGANLKCHQLAGMTFIGSVNQCYWHEVTYDSLELCKWNLP